MRFRLSQGPLCLALAMIFIIGSRIPYLSLGVCDPDEAVGALIGQSILEGGLPYVDAIDHRGPLSYYFFAAVFSLSGDISLEAMHIGLMSLVLGMAGMLYLLVRRAFSEEVAGWSVLIFGVLSWVGKPTDMLAAHTEWLMVFWTMLGLWVWLKEDETRFRHALLGGICMGIAALSKQVAIWDWLVFPIGLVLLAQRGSKQWPLAIMEAVFAGIGFAIPLLIVMGTYSAMGQWEAFYTYAWAYNVETYMPVLGWGRRLRNTWELLFTFSIGKSLLLALSAAGAGMLIRKETGKIQTLLPPAQLLLGVWIALTLAGSITGGRNFGHYLIQALPGLAILGGFALGEIQRLSKDSFLLKPLLLALVAFGIAYPPLVAYGMYYRPWLKARSESAIGPLTAYLQPKGDAGKSLFVWGFAPHYYAETGMKPASRFLFTTFQTGVVPVENAHLEQVEAFARPESWDPLWEDLQANAPDYILDAARDDFSFMGWHPLARYPELQQWVDTYYEKDSTYHTLYPEHTVHLYQKKELAGAE